MPWALSTRCFAESSVRGDFDSQSAPPLPWYHARPEITKLDQIIRARFRAMYGDRISLKTSELKEWGSFLAERGISWEMKLPKKPDWEGWEVEDGKGCYIVRLKGLDNHVRVNHYFIPRELAMKMLVFGELV